MKQMDKLSKSKLPQFSEAAFFPNKPDRLNWDQSVRLFLESSDGRDSASSLKGLASVLFLFMRENDESDWKVILTKRSASMPSHKGQIGFAGGHREESEDYPEETAIREAEEELGIDAANINILGRVTPLWSIDQKMVVPVVACLEGEYNSLEFDRREIERLIICEVDALLESRAKEFEFILFGKKRQSWLFEYLDEEVWGLTAKIIKLAGLKP